MESEIMRDLNILIVGVGGQGTLLASKILGSIALSAKLDVKLSEVHGMAQRGGSVVTHVRMSEREVFAPIIEEGMADVLMAFELLEGYRWVSFLKPGGSMLVNTQQINPMPVIQGAAEYPKDIEAYLSNHIKDVVFIDALSGALEAGDKRVVNTVLMGVLAKKLPFEKDIWYKAIEDTIKPQFIEMNKKAFDIGYRQA
jgi:indolepyruvate ferredoxin oxidoreductase beta subunit